MCISPITINGKQFPCGKCVECSKQYQNSIAIRCSEESKEWKHSYFITLTYDDNHLPTKRILPYQAEYLGPGDTPIRQQFYKLSSAEKYVNEHDLILTKPIYNVFDYIKDYLQEINNPKANAPYQSLELLSGSRSIKFPTQRKGDFQTFIKSLRKSLDRAGNGEKVKYLFSSEYGENTWRPHYHVVLFSNLPFETIKPMVDHYWQMGNIDIHEVKDVYKGKYCDKQAAFLYASKYVVKPDFLLNPLERCGLVDPCFRAWSKGLGRSYRKFFKNNADKIIDKINSSMSEVKETSFVSIVSHNEDTGKDLLSTSIVSMFDAVPFFNKQIQYIDGVNVELLDDLINHCQYKLYNGKNVLTYTMPRYYKEIIKPKKKIISEEIDYETGEVIKKVLERIDDTVRWYTIYKMYVEYCHIREVYRDLQAKGEITSEDSINSKIFKIRVALTEIDPERVEQAYKKSYQRNTNSER